jgi:poly-gamma-glutamate capsule biosynthesis protein CapA/YwtB (metallophosphatase superfamily)
MTSTAIIQLHHRETFERNVTRALLAGAAAGGVAWLFSLARLGVPVALLALVGACLAFVRGTVRERLGLAAAATLLPALPWYFTLSQAWTVALAGAMAGGVMAWARMREKGEEGSVASQRPGAVHAVAGVLATGALAVAGSQVAQILGARLAEVQTPALLAAVASGAVVALFAGIGSLATHVALESDPVEAACEALLPELSGDFALLLGKALTSYRQSGQQLAALPREPAREELARTLQKLMRDTAGLVKEWAGVEATVQAHARADVEREIADLRASAASARDGVARQQLAQAAASLSEELERLGEVELKRERVVAKVRSQVALLERARVALIGMRSSHATVRAAELAAVARKLNAQALGQSDEARLAHEVATSAELAAADAVAAEAATRARLESTQVGVSPVVEVTAPARSPGTREPE